MLLCSILDRTKIKHHKKGKNKILINNFLQKTRFEYLHCFPTLLIINNRNDLLQGQLNLPYQMMLMTFRTVLICTKQILNINRNISKYGTGKSNR